MRSRPVRAGTELLAWIATVAGATGIALHFSRSSARLLVLAASVAPYLMCSAVVAAVTFTVLRRRSGAAAAVIVAALGVWTQVPLYAGDSGAGSGPELTVMQANLLFEGADPRALVEEVRARRVTILTVNELTPAALGELTLAGLDHLLPHRYVSPGRTATGTGIYSAYPLTDTVEYDGYVLNQLSATATVPGAGPVTVYAFHPVPPIYGTDVWSDELSRLRAILDRAPGDRPAIAGGDFNATFDHSQFRAMLSGRFHDAAEQSGAGHLVTYPTDKAFPPLIGIDHILLAGAHATRVATVALPGADHRALVADLRLASAVQPRQ
ncbi:endonuclease/exonuclease/phosphatase family protein [Nocardia goodfellowii]|uniref:Endonuclease/exonuclease/phosphatase (EEP) superfamily protein YafD n=1 Tax=Nocardia goodfellowii TaxID=882446 RepID=A0ABS4QFX8_9NOCA|nr:endonuclease/exonuclease/phosphatase family protein [Nocardia goodfellowii]MBP2190055.1 endonuclease/exonuclease/phosphatase (EEP) superfamily protein YafD [Nocardia goodfellowii]